MPPPDKKAIEAAVKAFVRAVYLEPPEVIYHILVDQQTILLSEAANQYMEERVRLEPFGWFDPDFTQLQFQLGPPGPNAPVPSLKAIFLVPSELLTDARVRGIDTAWQRFVMKYVK